MKSVQRTSVSKLKVCSRGHKFYKSSACPVCPFCWPARRSLGEGGRGYYKEKHGKEFPGLGAPALRALLNAGVTTAKQLSRYSEQDILKLHGMGPSSLPLLRSALKAKRLSFEK